MFRLLLATVVSGYLLAQTVELAQQRKSPPRLNAPKKKAEPPPEVYDPNNLPQGEIACGGRKRDPHPCQCMKHRVEISERNQQKCRLIADRLERAKCIVENEACSLMPVDAEHSWVDGEQMPITCKRSCHKARCECCTS